MVVCTYLIHNSIQASTSKDRIYRVTCTIKSVQLDNECYKTYKLVVIYNRKLRKRNINKKDKSIVFGYSPKSTRRNVLLLLKIKCIRFVFRYMRISYRTYPMLLNCSRGFSLQIRISKKNITRFSTCLARKKKNTMIFCIRITSIIYCIITTTT